MSNRKTAFFYGVLIAVASLAVGLVLASRLGLSPQSSAQTLSIAAANHAPLNGPIDAATFRNIAKAVTPAVVTIKSELRQARDTGEVPQDLFDLFGQPGDRRPRRNRPQRPETAIASGTGFVIDKAGFILTNSHVVDGAVSVKVSFFGEEDVQEYAAKVVGRDELSDSALLELIERPTQPLPVVTFGDSSQMQPGDWVMAIGNPFRFSHTVSVGVVSAVGRPYDVAEQRKQPVIQTDAAINPGNSGGPLLNVRGEVIGMNTAIYTDERQVNIGIGFAMPINLIRDLLPQLRQGKITRGRMGVVVEPIRGNAVEKLGLKSREGALVNRVTKGGAAAKAGLEAGDVIVGYNGKPVKKNDDLVQMVTATAPGTRVPVRIVRDGAEKTVTVVIEELDLAQETRQTSDDTNSRDRESNGVHETSSFGLTFGNVTPDIVRRLRLDGAVKGAILLDVEPDSPAERAGLAVDDIILRVDRQVVASAADTQRALTKVLPGTPAFLRILRNNQEQLVSVTKE